jgi:cytochrome-b5 reductase
MGWFLDGTKLAAPLSIGIIIISYLIWRRLKDVKKVYKVFLEGAQVKKKAKISKIASLTHDTKLFRLDLGGPDVKLGLPTGSHFVLNCPNPVFSRTEKTWNGQPDTSEANLEIVERKYTPVTNDETTSGHVDLVIKIYRPGNVKMPDGSERDWTDGGKMSLHLDKLKVGDYLEMRGPVGVVRYLGQGAFKYPGNPNRQFKEVGMMAGGTGITPMLQILQSSLLDPEDKTKFSLIYANKTENDILVKDLLDEAVVHGNGRIKVHYTLDFPPDNWPKQYSKGFITKDMIRENLPPPSEDNTLVLMCGPPPMVNFACKANLKEMNYSTSTMVAF